MLDDVVGIYKILSRPDKQLYSPKNCDLLTGNGLSNKAAGRQDYSPIPHYFWHWRLLAGIVNPITITITVPLLFNLYAKNKCGIQQNI